MARYRGESDPVQQPVEQAPVEHLAAPEEPQTFGTDKAATYVKQQLSNKGLNWGAFVDFVKAHEPQEKAFLLFLAEQIPDQPLRDAIVVLINAELP